MYCIQIANSICALHIVYSMFDGMRFMWIKVAKMEESHRKYYDNGDWQSEGINCECFKWKRNFDGNISNERINKNILNLHEFCNHHQQPPKVVSGHIFIHSSRTFDTNLTWWIDRDREREREDVNGVAKIEAARHFLAGNHLINYSAFSAFTSMIR